MRATPTPSRSTWRAVPERDGRPPLRLGTRRSALARAQAELVAARLPRPVTIVPIAVGADTDRRPLGELAGSRAFTGTIERRLVDGDIDLAVHALKDLPVAPLRGLRVAARLPRGRVGDLLLKRGSDAAEPLGLPVGARVGTASPRRAALLAAHAPQALAVPIRGNVPTRIERCVDGSVDAVLLAQAGIDRLGSALDALLAELERVPLDPPGWLPAPGQAAIAVQARDGDDDLLAELAAIDDADTGIAVDLERRLLKRAGGGCRASLGAYARPIGGGRWRADVGLLDEQDRWRARHAAGDPETIEPALGDWIGRLSPGGSAT